MPNHGRGYEAGVRRNRDADHAKGSHKKETADTTSRLLQYLLGEEAYETVSIEPGFPYKETPPGFVDFLSNHRSTFCIDRERVRLWKRVVADDEDPNQVFNAFTDHGGGIGTGAVIATIMTEELKNEPLHEGS